jgi:hypothetical protein
MTLLIHQGETVLNKLPLSSCIRLIKDESLGKKLSYEKLFQLVQKDRYLNTSTSSSGAKNGEKTIGIITTNLDNFSKSQKLETEKGVI